MRPRREEKKCGGFAPVCHQKPAAHSDTVVDTDGGEAKAMTGSASFAGETRPDPTTDETLVDRVRAGDLAAFELLIRRHNQKLFRAIRAILRDGAELEDVMQDTYL